MAKLQNVDIPPSSLSLKFCQLLLISLCVQQRSASKWLNIKGRKDLKN